jgi:hypothetical protein
MNWSFGIRLLKLKGIGIMDNVDSAPLNADAERRYATGEDGEFVIGQS